MKHSKLPNTDSIQELSEFWDTHDLTDFEDELAEVAKPAFVRRTARKAALESPEAILIDNDAALPEGAAMSLTEVLPEVQTLSRSDKIRLIQFLALQLEHDEGGLIEAGRSYPVWSPDQSFRAAAALLQALEDEKGQP